MRIQHLKLRDHFCSKKHEELIVCVTKYSSRFKTLALMFPWASKCGIKFPNAKTISLVHKVVQQQQQDTTTTSSSSPPRRGIFVAESSSIAKGQLIAIIPLRQSVLLPQHAAGYLRKLDVMMMGSNKIKSNNSNSLPLYDTALKIASNNPMAKIAAAGMKENGGGGELQHNRALLPWFSRDQVLVTSALAAWKYSRAVVSVLKQQQQQEAETTHHHHPWDPFDSYLKLLPKNVPFTASTKLQLQLQQQEQQEQGNQNTNYSINRFASPLDTRQMPSSNNNNSTNKNVLSFPSSSINHGEAVTSNRHLTQLEHVGLLGKSLNFMSHHFAESLVLSSSISSCFQLVDNHQLMKTLLFSEARKAFAWAHFMVRSRSVSPLLEDLEKVEEDQYYFDENNNEAKKGTSLSLQQDYHKQPLLIPFVDMFNHDMKDANVSVAWNRGSSLSNSQDANEREILVTASKDIPKGGELLMNYANLKQRGKFMFAPDLHFHNNNNTNDDNQLIFTPPVRKLLSAQRSAGVCEDVNSWEWQYGFQIPSIELEYVRELLWAASLQSRVKRMMNIRRKGRPGEFVVGVPEGLQALRRQRERIERESYGGKRIFPPQAE